MKENIQVTRFSNGLTVLTEKMPDLRSATLGFFFNTGSRDEPDELNGISHFIEHTVFKGTKKRSPVDIAIESDRLGGSIDAFTMHEETGFAIKVVDKQITLAFDLLADMLSKPLFDDKELKRERRVIIEEMKMVEDNPEDFLGEIFADKFFPDHPLGLSIAGTPKTVRKFDHETTRKYHQQAFHPANLIIAAAGNIEHQAISDLAESFFGGRPKLKGKKAGKNSPPILANPIFIKRNTNLEQAHLIIATPFTSAVDERRYASDLLTNIIGGGTSSRLWQKIREERGLAYSVGASAAMFRDCGFFSIYAGTSPKQVEEILDIAIEELRLIVKNGVTVEELELVKAQSTASILLGLEDSSVRAGTLARLEMLFGRQIPLEETLQRIEEVTPDDIQAVVHEYFKTENIAFAALGDLNGLRVRRERLTI
jgi:predicted Zn-dependent peptidase